MDFQQSKIIDLEEMWSAKTLYKNFLNKFNLDQREVCKVLWYDHQKQSKNFKFKQISILGELGQSMGEFMRIIKLLHKNEEDRNIVDLIIAVKCIRAKFQKEYLMEKYTKNFSQLTHHNSILQKNDGTLQIKTYISQGDLLTNGIYSQIHKYLYSINLDSWINVFIL